MEQGPIIKTRVKTEILINARMYFTEHKLDIANDIGVVGYEVLELEYPVLLQTTEYKPVYQVG